MSQQQSLGGFIKQTWSSAQKGIVALCKAFMLLWQSSPKYTALSSTIYIIEGVIPAAQIWLIKSLVDRVTLEMQSLDQADWRTWIIPALMIVVLKLVKIWTESIAVTVRDLLQIDTVLYTQHKIFAKTAELDVAFFENPKFYDQLVAARNDIWRLHSVPVIALGVLRQILTLILTIGLLLRYQPWAVAVLFLTAIPHAVLKSYFDIKQFELFIGQIPAQRMVDYIGYRLLGVREAVKEIRIFGLEAKLLERFVEFRHKRMDEQIGLSKRTVRTATLLSFIPAIGIAYTWITAFIRATTGAIGLGTLTLLVQAADQIQYGFQILMQQIGYLYGNTLYLNQLFDYLNLTTDKVEGSLKRPETTHPVPDTISDCITFEDVSFRYPGSEGDVLKHLSFTLNPGETVALVGANGAGKTTLVKLLARQFDPRDGTISLDGRDLIEYDLDSYLRQIGVIFQDYVQYHLPVRDNIGFGRVEALDDDVRLLRAAELGGARDLIDDLPDGLDTMLGKTFEGGTDLSGGQWQKLALSRAFMRDGQILILDEPTASLDALAEMEIYQRFADLVAGKIGIIVSHRFSTVKMADHILVLKDGELIEEGDHNSLMALQGHYAEMYTAQAQNYQ